jgi:murein DD-endopeptidase MepM/ murein hydrolase activator NlpD
MENKLLNNKKLTIFFVLFFIIAFFITQAPKVLANCCCLGYIGSDRWCQEAGSCELCQRWKTDNLYQKKFERIETISGGCPSQMMSNCFDGVFNPATGVDGQAEQNLGKTSVPIVPKISIPIPGLNLTSDAKLLRVCSECNEVISDASACPDDKCAKWTYKIPWIGEYVFAFYKWAVLAIAVFAVLVIVNAAFSMVTAGGNSAKITAARDSLFAGIIGVILILVAHQVLYMVDPRLVVLKPIIIGSIKKVEFPVMESDVEQGAVNPSSGNGLNASITATCFPVGSNSLNHVSWNWGSKRSDGKRCHAGVDIFTKGTGQVFAMADGKVINNFFFYKCSGGNSNAILVDHGSFVALYGEINSDTATITTGSTIKAGQFLGNATYCGMLHFELYTQGTTINYRWSPPDGRTVGSEANYCRNNYLSTKPSHLIDPTETVKGLQGKNCQ